MIGLWLSGIASACPTKDYDGNAVIVVAVANPSLAEGPRPLPFAERDANQIAQFFRSQFGDAKVFALKTASETTTAALRSCLNAVARHAQRGSKTILFISARGYMSSRMNDGYLLTSNASIEKLPGRSDFKVGNGIPFEEIKQTLGRMDPFAERYLLLDLCRDPVESMTVSNLINLRVLEKEFLSGIRTRRIILASKGSRPSYASYYAESLLDAMRANPRTKLEELFQSVKQSVEKKARTEKQTPERPVLAPPDQDSCPLCKLKAALRGPLLASAVPFLPWGDGEMPDATAKERVLGAAAEDRGQKVFVRYGEGNHFYGDPLHMCQEAKPEYRSFRLCSEEFEEAAKAFHEAADHYRSAPDADGAADRALLDSLSEREDFCRWQAEMLRTETMEVEAKKSKLNEILRQVKAVHYAEAHNLRGIALLELAEYAKAEEEFQKAIEKAPFWAYPRHNLALAMIEHGNYAGAEKAYLDAIMAVPIREKIAADANTGNACFGTRAQAVGARPYLYYNLAVLLQRVNRLSEAKKQYCLAELSFRLSMSLDSARGLDGDPDRALPGLRARAAKTNLADVNNSLGVLFVSKNQRDRAERQFNAALENEPGLAAAHFNLARLHAQRDKPRALQIYEAAKQKMGCVTGELACQAVDKEIDRLRKAGGD